MFAEALTAGTPLGTSARERLAHAGRWHAPAILPAEVLSAIRGLAQAGHLPPEQAERARRRLQRTRVTLHPFAPFADRVWELRDKLTVYDAWYIAVAERLETLLVTTDARLAGATGPTCEVELLRA